MRITVVGGGVSGLTTALVLRRRGHEADVVAAAPGTASTSVYAAAIWWPVFDEPRDLVTAWARRGLGVFEGLVDDPAAGVQIIQITEYADHPISMHGWDEWIPGFRALRTDELPAGRAAGVTMTVPQVTPTVYLPWLEDRLEETGGTVTITGAPLASLDDLFAGADIVVNCTGVGARDLVGDTSVHPIRGQVVAVRDPGVTAGWIDESGGPDIVYVFPRTNEVILGGTRWPEVWDDTPDEVQTARILAEAKQICPGLRTDDVIEARVGLRPGRPTVRLETEQTPAGTVVHNYGHSGNGYTLSWGCAEAVADLITTL